MLVLLWLALIIISLILFAMILFGIYYVVANIQVKLLYRVLDELWDHCSLIYYYMDDNTKEIFSKKLECELGMEPELIDFELEEDDENHTILKKLLASVPMLYKKFDKMFERSCLLARDLAYGSDEEVREVTNLINSILGVW